MAKGRADLGFTWQIGAVIARTSAVLVGAHYGGPIGVATSLIIFHLVFHVLGYRMLIRKLLGPCLKGYFMSMAPPIALALVMSLAVAAMSLIVQNQAEFASLIAQVAFGAALYLGLVVVFMRSTVTEFARLAIRRA